MYNHIKQFYFRLAFSAAAMAFFAIFYGWSMTTWLGSILIVLVFVYLLDTYWIFLKNTT
jgi:hypothetical protein